MRTQSKTCSLPVTWRQRSCPRVRCWSRDRTTMCVVSCSVGLLFKWWWKNSRWCKSSNKKDLVWRTPGPGCLGHYPKRNRFHLIPGELGVHTVRARYILFCTTRMLSTTPIISDGVCWLWRQCLDSFTRESTGGRKNVFLVQERDESHHSCPTRSLCGCHELSRWFAELIVHS